MPVIVQAKDTKIVRDGQGWRQIGLADNETFGTQAMIAYRWIFDPGARGPKLTLSDSDQLLYVIRGNGTAEVDGLSHPLSEESVLWLELGEQYCFIAGDDGLEVLQGFVPD